MWDRIQRRHSVIALALPGVITYDLAIAGEVFGHPDLRLAYDFAVCTPEPGRVRANVGFDIHVDNGLQALETADTVVVPGYLPLSDPPPEVLSALRDAHDRGARIVALCTGAFAVGAAGLVDGRRVTTHWLELDRLAKRFPAATVDRHVLYIEDRGVSTCAGVGAGLDLCIHLVCLDVDAETATRIGERMVVGPHRAGDQAPMLERSRVRSGLTGLSHTLDWSVSQLSEKLTIGQMAEHSGWAPSTFARRFVAEVGMTPLRWLTIQRIGEAKRLLETTDFTMELIAHLCGFGTSSTLRHHFSREMGLSPAAYRKRAREPRQDLDLQSEERLVTRYAGAA
ncbi:AraC family transcriptional activator FtrA [Microbacterium sp. BE35]|uniref:GlxA family transcriptional regulator n=1 Tax=Microbacterium sp. BE35 TaxID=2817773 RepID=UPI002863BBEA|nr:helix-turn-helix domain-containing protein [Microbacterium sp. BE35]MDR7188189.1 AraC family transcriptional activator FtrA [Microbacterium sp. BE35]